MCEVAHPISSLPYNTADSLVNYGSDYSGSPGTYCGTTLEFLNSHEVVYAYTAVDDMPIIVSLISEGVPFLGVFVYDDCADIGTECVAGKRYNGNYLEFEMDVYHWYDLLYYDFHIFFSANVFI